MFGFGRKKDTASQMVYDELKREEMQRIRTAQDAAKLEKLKNQALAAARREAVPARERAQEALAAAGSRLKGAASKAAPKVQAAMQRFGKNLAGSGGNVKAKMAALGARNGGGPSFLSGGPDRPSLAGFQARPPGEARLPGKVKTKTVIRYE